MLFEEDNLIKIGFKTVLTEHCEHDTTQNSTNITIKEVMLA